MENVPVPKVDILAFAGKWYTLYSIPMLVDKHWRQTTETYIIHPDGYYAVFTTYRIAEEEERRFVRSKLFVVPGTKNTMFKAQFIWPFRIDYWVIELADDYSYTVIGHPKHKYLFIMSRKAGLSEELLAGIFDRCNKKGYDTSRLVSQQHVINVTEELTH